MSFGDFFTRARNKLKRLTPNWRIITPAERALLAEMPYYRGSEKAAFPIDYAPEEKEIIQRVRPYTMTSSERIVSLLQAVEHLVTQNIDGAFVECGVWRGGSMMAAALQLLRLKKADRKLYLFDTFSGMSDPDERDLQFDGQKAESFLGIDNNGEKAGAYWCVASFEDVSENLSKTGYPEKQIQYVKGKVEETIPCKGLGPIALLRLDTDWYQSTYHEMHHLYDLVVPGGIIIIDDYGHWQGARKAITDFFAERGAQPFLHRIDYSGRLIIKP